MSRRPRALPGSARGLLDAKGPENAARVRRIVRTVSALHARPTDWTGLRVLDLGCGEGLFALEAAVQGADVLAVDGREERMAAGRALASELDLPNLRFQRADVLDFPFQAEGPFDVVLCLGLLYHLEAGVLVETLERIARATGRTLLLETHVAPHGGETLRDGPRAYRGFTYREHAPDDPEPVRRARLLASLSSDTAFWPTRASLLDLLEAAGFPTVLECALPRQPFQAEDRLTLAALKGAAPPVASLPGIDAASEEEVRRRSGSASQVLPLPPCGDARADTVTDVVVTLGGWARAHPEFVLGTRGVGARADAFEGAPDAALWHRETLARYTGRLRRVPPRLAVEVEGPGDDPDALRRKAEWLLEAGTSAVWIVRAAPAEVVVMTAGGRARIGPDEALPPIPGLPGLAPPARELLCTAIAERS